jgi:hypothetical protein
MVPDPARHAELVSASMLEMPLRVAIWTLNQVQGDEGVES